LQLGVSPAVAITRSLGMSVEKQPRCQQSSIYSGYWTSIRSY